MSGTVHIAGHGMMAALPPGWDATIYRRTPDPGETTNPIFHAATVALPPLRGDYGSGVVEMLGAEDIFVSLIEFDPSNTAKPLFSSVGLPAVTADMFRPKQLQRIIAGQGGLQRFFQVGGRAFCLYVVIGAIANVQTLAARANQVIAGVTVNPLTGGGG